MILLLSGTFVPYDPIKDIDGPKNKGFAGGNFYGDNSTEYVAYGNFSASSSCVFQNPSPGYIRTVPLIAGVYLACGNADEYSSTTGFYLSAHPNLKWVLSNVTEMFKLPTALKLNRQNPFMFGRILYQGYQYVGKLHASGDSGMIFIETATGVKSFTNGFEVLTCS